MNDAQVTREKLDTTFGLLVDKGTFDAILVEGTVYQYVINVYSLMKPGSVYVLISLHDEAFMSPFFGSGKYRHQIHA
jgi:hypothetical protein